MPTEDFLPEAMTFFASRWWTVCSRGFVALTFGALTVAWPGVTLGILVHLFGFYALGDGVFSLLAAVGGQRSREHRRLLILEGIVSLWAGVISLHTPWVAGAALLLLISIWAMTTGLLRIAASSRLREELSGEILLAMSGAIAVLFALALLLSPVPDALAFRWVIGGYAIAVGLLHLMLGFELRYMKTLLAP